LTVNAKPNIVPIYKYLMGAVLLSISVVLLFRNLPVGPILAGDEMQYSMMARKLPYHLDWIPNYLFSLVYGSTNYCGAQFYSCSKIINVLFFSLSGFFVFKTTRLFTGPIISLLVMLAYLVSPFNVYTTQFMPEIMYGAAAWILLYFFVSRGPAWRVRSVIASGAGVAILAMIKPHGVFFGAGYLIALILDMAITEGNNVNPIAMKVVIFAASFLAVRLPIGYLFAGTSGLSVFGVSYSAIASHHRMADYLRVFGLAASSALRHVLAMALIAGVPLCIVLVRAFHSSPDTVKAVRLNRFAAIFFIVMIGITAAFTATVANTAPGETISRLHTRYYNFFDFLFYLIVVAELMRNDPEKLASRALTGTCIGAIAILSIVYLPSHFQQGLMDNPDIHGLFLSDSWFHIFAILNTVLVALWIYRSRAAGLLFLTLQLPLGLILSVNLLTQDIRSLAEYHNSYPKAGDLARVIWGKPLPDFFVAGTEVGEEFHTLFHLDKDGTRIELAPNQSLHRTVIPKGVSNGIVIGEHGIDFPYVLTYADGPIKIIKIMDP
jgi:phosphoglycerol transferase